MGPDMRHRTRRAVVGAVLAVATAAGTGVAWADSNSRNWTASSVLTGFESQRVTRTSSLGALVLAQYSCNFTQNAPFEQGQVGWNMYRDRSFSPDDDLGRLTSPCWTGGTWTGDSYRNYGGPAPATYHFTYTAYGSSYSYNGRQNSTGQEKW